MKKLETITVGSGGAAQIEFTSIAGTYTDLLVMVSARGTGDMKIVFNSNTSGYSRRHLYGNGGSAGSASGADGYIGRSVPTANTANTFSNHSIYLPNYASTTTHKSYSVDCVDENNTSSAYQIFLAGIWSNTAAITSIALSDYGTGGLTFTEGTTATLYGITKGSGGATVS